jgi:hypothetical protein
MTDTQIPAVIRPGTAIVAPNGAPTADSPESYRVVPPQRALAETLGPLEDLPGYWEGTGFSLIARPDFSSGNADGVFLELNLLRETIEFTTIGSPVFNRGSVQDDISIYGVTYLHRVTDATTGSALHIEPGLWLNIPATANPHSDASIARLLTIPHGNAVCTVGFAENVVFDKLPEIPPANTVPFAIGSQPPPPGTPNAYAAYDLSRPSLFRTATVPAGITQDVINDPNVVVREALEGHVLTHITRLITSTTLASGGGAGSIAIGNIPFITRNADTLTLDSVFAIETVQGPMGTPYLQLQYSQTALLNFRGMSFPHVTVGTLIKAF